MKFLSSLNLGTASQSRIRTWTPLDMTSWVSLYDVWADPSGVVETDSRVSQWTDMVGTRHLTQGNASYRPVKAGDGSIDFDGAAFEHLGYEGFSSTPDWIVAFMDPDATQSGIAEPLGLNLNGGAAKLSGNGIRYNGNNAYLNTNSGDYSYNGPGSHNIRVNGEVTLTHNAGPHVIVAQLGSGGFASNRAQVNIGGNGNDGGGNPGGANFWWSGKYYFLGFRDVAPTADEILQLEGYAAWQSGASTILVAGHLYRDRRPRVRASYLPDGYEWVTDAGEQVTDDGLNIYAMA